MLRSYIFPKRRR